MIAFALLVRAAELSETKAFWPGWKEEKVPCCLIDCSACTEMYEQIIYTTYKEMAKRYEEEEQQRQWDDYVAEWYPESDDYYAQQNGCWWEKL